MKEQIEYYIDTVSGIRCQVCDGYYAHPKPHESPESAYEWDKALMGHFRIPFPDKYQEGTTQRIEEQIEHLFKSGQITEQMYEYGETGLKLLQGLEPTLDDKLHLVLDVSGADSDDNVPF